MKKLNRMLAILMAALMLCGMFGAVAETEVAIEAPLDDGYAGLDFSGDALELSGDLTLVEADVEAAVVANDAEPTPPAAPFTIDENGVLVKYNGTDAEVTIPDNVVAIGVDAFKGNATLTRVTIPAGVASIRARAFEGCENLAVVTVLAKEIEIAATAFKGLTPAFHTVVGSSAADWARKCDFTVEDNLVLLTRTTTMKVAKGETYRLVLSGRKAVSFASSNTAVATVSDKGVVKIVNGGSAQITVTLEGGQTLTLILNAAYPEAVLSNTSLKLNVGKSKVLTVKQLSGRTVSWSSTDSTVATVKDGRVTAVKAGRCTIVAQLSDGKTLKCKVKVSDPAKLSKTFLDMKVNDAYTLKISGLAGRSVAWSSSDSAVATVDKNGRVTAKKAGSCTITAQIRNGKTLKCNVKVTDPAKITQTSLSLRVGASHTLSVHHLCGRTVTWSSSNSAVATVDRNGKVTGKRAGTCTITARLSDGRTFTCKVTVTDPASISRTTLTLNEGETFTLTVSGSGSGSVTWTSSDTDIATVDSTGKVTAVKAGACTITARLSSGTSLQCKVTVNAKQ